LKKDLNGTRW